jgi:hypothetical protein
LHRTASPAKTIEKQLIRLQRAVVSQQRPSCQHLLSHQLGNIWSSSSRLLPLLRLTCCCCSPAGLWGLAGLLLVPVGVLLLLCPLPLCADLLVCLQHLIISCFLGCVYAKQ